MRILALSKRRYMGKDVIDDRYGRLYELPFHLARRGHRVLGVCTGYGRQERGEYRHFDDGSGSLVWRGCNAAFDLPRYEWLLPRLAKAFRPDLIFSGSDALHVSIGSRLARKLAIPHAVDLYDNFESFGLTRFPGLRRAFRKALREADAISCVSRPLAARIAGETGVKSVIPLESAIPEGLFAPGDRAEARRRLDLPGDALLVGSAGALHRNRGITALYDAFLHLAGETPSLHLALAGPVDGRAAPPDHPRVHYLGRLPHDRIPGFYNALDVAVICMEESPFGDFAFPQKTYEILASETPLVAAGVTALADLFRGEPQCLYTPGDSVDLANRIRAQLSAPRLPRFAIPTWEDQARALETLLQTARDAA